MHRFRRETVDAIGVAVPRGGSLLRRCSDRMLDLAACLGVIAIFMSLAGLCLALNSGIANLLLDQRSAEHTDLRECAPGPSPVRAIPTGMEAM